MNQTKLPVIAALMLIIAAVLFVKFSVSSSGDGEPKQADLNREDRTSGVRSSAGSRRERLSPVEAADSLRQLIMAERKANPDFEEVERLVRRVSMEVLQSLRDELASVRADGAGGWVRCAVHAELARRDPEAAMEWLISSPDLANYDGWGYRQIWFSTFRGWAKNDPAAALAKLHEFSSTTERTGRVMLPEEIGDHDDYLQFIQRDHIWQLQAFQEVFREYARYDLEAALTAVPDAGIDVVGYRDAIVEGILSGVQGEEDTRKLVGRWGSGRYAIELRIESRSPFSDDEGIRVRDMDARPNRSSITVQAALALEAVRPGSGLEWLQSHNSGGVAEEQETLTAFYDDYAREFPDQALGTLQGRAQPELALLGSLLRQHPGLADEGFALLDQKGRYDATLLAIDGSSSLEVEDLFPVSGRDNRTGDWQQRYEDMQKVVKAGGFEPDQEANLLGRLREEFASVSDLE